MSNIDDTSPRDTILIVDDSPETIDLVSSILGSEYRLKVATNGNRALQIALSTEKPDLILLDVMMPGMDGYETCEQLKANPETRDISVIFLTAKTEIDDEMRGFELGAVDYITKPISPPILKARVRTHLRMKKITDYLKDKIEEAGLL